MSTRVHWAWPLSAALTLVIAGWGSQPAQAQLEIGPPDQSLIIESPPPPSRLAEVSMYWLGVECQPVSPELRAQLKLEEGQGLVVRHVMPDSPAAKAGVEPHDVLLQFNEAAIGDISDLAKALDEGKDQEATLQVLRAGETMELKATPQKRPDDVVARTRRGWLRRWLAFDPDNKEPFRMLYVRPGVVAPAAVASPELPGGGVLTIAREGEGPLKVTYRQGEETWETTADKLEELPEAVRPFVRRALGVGEWSSHPFYPHGALFHHRNPGLQESMIDRGPHGGLILEMAPPDPQVLVDRLRLYQDKINKALESEGPGSPSDQGETVGQLRQAVEELRKEVQALRQERAPEEEN